jgi:Spy/CpxP family protein refolding chaperone
LALALSLGVASAASAQQPELPRQPQPNQGASQGPYQNSPYQQRAVAGRGNGLKQLVSGLNLSKTQKVQLKALMQKYKSQEVSMRNQIKPLREQLVAARKNNDQARLQDLRAQLRPHMQQFQALRDKEMQDVRTILTPQQQAQFDQNMAAMRASQPQRQQRQRPVRNTRVGLPR